VETENAYEVKGEALNVETMNPEDCPKEDKGDWEQPELVSDEDEEDDDDVPALDDFRGASKKLGDGQRASVSAEVFGSNNFKEEYVPTVVEKSEEAKARISTRLSQSFMFASLDEREKQIVLNAMKEHTYAKDDVVIRQGDDGEVLYCLDTGVLKCYRKMDKDAEYPGTFLKDYQPGEAFGE
jgi:cAMP-dependent protein kinase regulator